MDSFTMMYALLLKFWMTSWVKAKNYPCQTHHLLIKVNNQPSARFSRLFASSTFASDEMRVNCDKRGWKTSLDARNVSYISIIVDCLFQHQHTMSTFVHEHKHDSHVFLYWRDKVLIDYNLTDLWGAEKKELQYKSADVKSIFEKDKSILCIWCQLASWCHDGKCLWFQLFDQ